MTCVSEETVLLFLQGQLAAAAAAEVERHLDECPDCGAFLAEVGRTLSAADLPPVAPAPPDARDTSADDTAPLARSTTVGRYIILNPLGAGGMGVVYAAYDAELDRKVALKLLRPDGASTARAAEVRARLLREAQALARLQHPNVIAVYDAGTFRDEVFMAMELVDGTTLTRWLRAQQRPWREVVAMFLQAGAGLAAAHAAGLVHRDFKPDNVLVGKDGRARVVDFGLAVSALAPVREMDGEGTPETIPRAASLTRTGAHLGTPAYMAPEQHRGEGTDARTDQFSFCVTLYEALHGERPPGSAEDADPRGAVTGSERREPPRDHSVPARLQRVLRRGLSGARAARYPSMNALLTDLERNASPRWWKVTVAAGLAVLLAASGIAYGAREVRERQRCRAAGGALAGAWDAARKRRGQAAFVATGAANAGVEWTKVSGRLDAYAAQWSAARTEACEATRRGQQAEEIRDLRIECLNWKLHELSTLGTLLESADAKVVERATRIALLLTPVDTCASTTALTRRPRTPKDPARRAQADALRALVNRGRILYLAGRLQEAVALTRESATRADAVGQPAVGAEALHTLGYLLANADDFKASEDAHRQAVVAADACGHDEVRAKALSDLVWVISSGPHTSPARLDLAEQYGEMAAAVIERLGGDALLEANVSHNRGVLALSRGRFGEAQTRLERAVALFSRVSPQRPELTPSLQALGDALTQRGRLARAAEVLERALDSREKDVGPEHPRVAHYLTSLAAARAAQGRHEEAMILAGRALALTRRAFKNEHYVSAEALTLMANARASLGRLDEALALSREAQVIAEQTMGPDDPRVGLALNDVGKLLRLKGQIAEALAQQRRALSILERALEPEHSALARVLHDFGETLLADRKPAAALAPLGRALAIREPATIPPADLAATRFALAQALVAAGRDQERARALAVQARDGYAHAEGPHEAAVAAVNRWLAGAGR